jgi:hypothetical protein
MFSGSVAVIEYFGLRSKEIWTYLDVTCGTFHAYQCTFEILQRSESFRQKVF